MHRHIQISDFSLLINNKELFSDFTATIYAGSKIGIIGDNGSGKSSLLQLLSIIDRQDVDGITHGNDLQIAHVPQIISTYNDLSGGERFNKALSQALALYPNLILLDEPTNHLDIQNRKSLFNLLRHNSATQIVVSHDPQLLGLMDVIWHIYNQEIIIFNGTYQAYVHEHELRVQQLHTKVTQLKRTQQEQHRALMKEQQRAKNSRNAGELNIERRKWPTITSKTKAERASNTASKNNAKLNNLRNNTNEQLNTLWLPEEINYSFTLPSASHNSAVITVNNGSCGYANSGFMVVEINFNLFGGERLAICGANGSGKSTLVKAILDRSDIIRHGDWIVPELNRIAYFDQHYQNLPAHLSVFDFIASIYPCSDLEVRNFLNKFLFRKNEEVFNLIANLSGGEKARLALSVIALSKPELLILDEVTNNIDLTTRNHLVQVLQHYSGAILVISHDESFLSELDIINRLDVKSTNKR